MTPEGGRIAGTIAMVSPPPARYLPPVPPCRFGGHRWAWLTTGGQACGLCGTPRRGYL